MTKPFGMAKKHYREAKTKENREKTEYWGRTQRDAQQPSNLANQWPKSNQQIIIIQYRGRLKVGWKTPPINDL